MTLTKKLALILSIFSLSLSTSVLAEPIETRVPVDHVFVPKGFDSNDNGQLIISGTLPDLCHRSPKAKIDISDEQIKIELVALYSLPAETQYCTPIVVPFIEVVDLGLLDKGHYEILINGGEAENERSSIYVAESTSDAVDSNVYAGVEYVEKAEGSRKVKLKGYNPSDCFVLDKIEWESNGVDTYSVMPVMKKISDFCPMKMMPFTYEWEVPKELNRDVVLLHVRRVEGKSVNVLFRN